MRDDELQLHFEIDLDKRIFRARPKALREEDIVHLQREIRKYLAWKKLKILVK